MDLYAEPGLACSGTSRNRARLNPRAFERQDRKWLLRRKFHDCARWPDETFHRRIYLYSKRDDMETACHGGLMSRQQHGRPFHDVLIFVFPAKSIWRLQMPRRKRIGIVLLFATGPSKPWMIETGAIADRL